MHLLDHSVILKKESIKVNFKWYKNCSISLGDMQ